MKKLKQPGDNISLKTKKNEAPEVLEWINRQTNLMDSIRFLIENEIAANGIRNLQQHVPAERTLPFMQAQAEVAAAADKPDSVQYVSETRPAVQSTVQEQPEDDEFDEDEIDSWT